MSGVDFELRCELYLRSMQKLYPLLLLLMVPFFGIGQEYNVLFIGNSYTNNNNLPSLTSQFANSMGDVMTVDSNTPGGSTFNGHTNNTTTQNLIAEGTWDFVVLQEQSQLPSFSLGQVQAECFPYAAQLNDQILAANPCTETVFYMTWGRENGDASNCEVWPPVCSYEGMDDLLTERYGIMADDNDALVSPVGAVWRYIRTNHPEVDLYAGDGSHPSQSGSYAAAVSHYTTIYRKDPTQSTFDWQIDAVTADIIRAAVKTVVYDNMEAWNIGEYDPISSIEWNQADNLTFNFSAEDGFLSYEWTIEGMTYTDQNPMITFSGDGLYTVTLTVTNDCGVSGTSEEMVDVNVISVEEQESPLTLGPIPSNGTLNFQGIDKPTSVQLLDVTGKRFDLEFDGQQIQLPRSFYGQGIVLIYTDGKVFKRSVLKL